jgi:hypothetical protein
MRKVVASELVSLDGVMESPEKWSFQFHNDEMAEANERGWPRRTPCSWGG